MKKLGLLCIAALSAGLLLCSCNDSDGDYSSNQAFVTVKTMANNDYYFQLDDAKTLYPSDKKRVGDYEAKDEHRAIIYFNFLSPKVEGYDYNIALYGIREIYKGDTKIISTPEQLTELSDDPICFSGCRLNDNYINVEIGFSASDLSKHTFLLVRNDVTMIDSDNREAGYLNLELRRDANKDTNGYFRTPLYVSIPLDEFKTDLAGKKGIILRVNHAAQNGETTYKFYKCVFRK